MKIAFINGSPKRKNSGSASLLQDFKKMLPADSTITESLFFRPILEDSDLAPLADCDILVFAFPLYVDGLPSHLVANLAILEAFFKENPPRPVTVYAMVNCGFYEAKQNALATEILQHWCNKAGLRWGQGVCIGAGGMLASIKKVAPGKGSKKSLGLAFTALAENLIQQRSGETIFSSPDISSKAYQTAAQMGWRFSILKNRGKLKDLDRQIK